MIKGANPNIRWYDMKSIIMILLSALAIGQGGTCFALYDNTRPMYDNAEPMYYGNARPIYVNNNTGIYLKGFGGLNLAVKPHWRHAKWDASAGYVAGGAVGCHIGFLSVEGEFSYRHNSINHLVVNGTPILASRSGNLDQWCGFGNILFDVPITHWFAPHIGAGVGYRHTKPGFNFDESSDRSFQNFANSANEWGVYQVIAGLNFTTCNLVKLGLDYRYMDGWSSNRCSNHSVNLNAILQF